MLMVCVWRVRTVHRVHVWVPVILCVWMDWRESEKARARTRRQFRIHIYTIYVQFTWHNHHPFWMCSPCAWCFVLVLVLTQATQLPLLLIPFGISHSSTGHPNLTFSYNHIQTRTNFWASLSFGWERIEHKINKRRAIAHRKKSQRKEWRYENESLNVQFAWRYDFISAIFSSLTLFRIWSPCLRFYRCLRALLLFSSLSVKHPIAVCHKK